MLVFLQTLLMLRAAIAEWLTRQLRGAVSAAGDESPDEDQATADYDEERGVVFYPPVYAQRYAAVSDLLRDTRWAGQLEKVVDLGYHDTSFIKYLREVPGVRTILGVDLDSTPVAKNLFQCEEYATKREDPLRVVLLLGNAADPDYRLVGCDAVVSIEMLEHMLPHDLDRLLHTVFGFVRPRVAIFTTPNADFNVLFKTMLANGFRHWDHHFEWTRAQFHDWCSNVVSRYPEYSVSSQGVGPGPSDTAHLGCCTQLALFVNEHYQKRADLTPDSLMLVTKMQVTPKVSRLSTDIKANDNIEPTNVNSNINLKPACAILEHPVQSSLTIYVPTSEVAQEDARASLSDKPAQCNIRLETAKGYLMTSDDESGPTVLSADRKIHSRIYEIEDVNCRLNCSTIQIKRFSEKSSMLMANTKPDSLLHTEEMIGELKHLTHMLNLNRRSREPAPGTETLWNNINWGENAPYWNQYYSIVKEYEYPFQTKSPSERIMDLISDEIHRIVDQLDEEEWFFEQGRLEISLDRLMPIVKHISEDRESVRELLEWNGYEIINNNVIYSRLVSDDETEFEESETTNTDVEWDFSESMTLSEVTTVNPDCCDGRRTEDRLKRAIDRKVLRLREVLRDDHDVTSELETVVDKLASLALRHMGRAKEKTLRQTGVRLRERRRSRWMEHKLYDLLSLSEKAVRRRGKTAGNLPSSTPAREYDSYTEDQISVSSICTHQTFLEEVMGPPLQDDGRWPCRGSVELLESEKTLHEDTLGEFSTHTFEDSRMSIEKDVQSSDDLFLKIISPMQSCEKLNSNIGAKKSITKTRHSPHSRGRGKADILKDLALHRPIAELKGVALCLHKTERRRKGHKKKFRKNQNCPLKPINLTTVNPTEYLEPMLHLSEKEEDNDSSHSKEIDVYELSNDTENWVQRRSNDVALDEYDSFTTIPKGDDASSFIVADNKIYQSDFCEPSTSTGIRHTTVNVQCDLTPFMNPHFNKNRSLTPSPFSLEFNDKLSEDSKKIKVAKQNQAAFKEVAVPKSAMVLVNRIHPRLAYGGIHLHCFKDRIKYEDIVFHGQWQHQPKETKPDSKLSLLHSALAKKYPKVSSASVKAHQDFKLKNKKSVHSRKDKFHGHHGCVLKTNKMGAKIMPRPSIPMPKGVIKTFTAKNVSTANVEKSRFRSPETTKESHTIKANGENINGHKFVKKNHPERSPESFNNRNSTAKSSSSCSPCSVVTVKSRPKSATSPKHNTLSKLLEKPHTDSVKRSFNGNISKLEQNKGWNARNLTKSNTKNDNIENVPAKAVRKPLNIPKRLPLTNANKTIEMAIKTATIKEKPKWNVDKKSFKENKEPTNVLAISNLNSKSHVKNTNKLTESARKIEPAPINSNSAAAQSKFSIDSEQVWGQNESVSITNTSESFEKFNSGIESCSTEVFISNGASDVTFTPEDSDPDSEDPIVPAWLFNLLNNQPENTAGAEAEHARPPERREGAQDESAGAGDARRVHVVSYMMSEDSSSLLDTDTETDPSSTDCLRALNVEGLAVGRTQQNPHSNSSCTAVADSWVPAEGGRWDVQWERSGGAVRREAPADDSVSGTDADVSSLETDARDN